MADPLPPIINPAPSPTGTPVVAPTAVPWLLVLLVALNGGALAVSQAAPSPKVGLLASVVVNAVGAILGLLSPGLRKKDGA